MVIQYDDIPFKLVFFTEKNNRSQNVTSFYKNEDDLYHVDTSVEIVENLKLEVFFECPDSEARL